jgi:hypothetical protein
MKSKILDYNKRCSEFLGAEINGELERIYIDKMEDPEMMFHNLSVTLGTYEWNGTTNVHYIPFDMLEFHEDWNWIIFIVLKIRGTYNPKSHGDTTCSSMKDDIRAHLGRANKEALIKSIDNFLIWYKKNK